ncbi:MAG: hypothetical protein OI74_14440 [Gammaproteobacteria bacterium (ex Lamellibrachia satsuma)]|nr:MAG: cyclic nucleotide-binding domain-containing protein [Gammaproteobacteria bacterium (ex Lamellibrachia satsuma)]RRS31534.1 MAG: hypothetical protein OI74_14440 [Gammaproteobacteria bacterium (ex Lamellibrachia satsuma)]RRS35821.1 MAG: hypothetical protein NV67_09140 [Gammaproteobacteria bacterium (ex Lamellibrachia satsuma)]
MRTGQIKRIILLGDLRTYRQGEVIFEEGEESNELFVVLNGRINSSSERMNNHKITARTLGAGDVFGAASLMCDQKRLITTTAEGETQVLCLHWSRIHRLIKYSPVSAVLFFKNLANILGARFQNQQLFVNFSSECKISRIKLPECPTSTSQTEAST